MAVYQRATQLSTPWTWGSRELLMTQQLGKGKFKFVDPVSDLKSVLLGLGRWLSG